MSITTHFLIYKWTYIFYISLTLLVYFNRKKFEIQGGFIALYKTKFGLNLMDKIAKKHNRAVKIFGTLGIYVGYIGFLVFSYLLILVFKSLIDKPDLVALTPVIPGTHVAGVGIFPLVTGWVALSIIIIVHEFSHGVVARAYGLKVLSSGLAFFGPIFGAFVEPDEKEIEKQSAKVQNSIYAAGAFSNILLTVFTFIILTFAIVPVVNSIAAPVGVKISPILNESLPAESSGLTSQVILTEINGVLVNKETIKGGLFNISPGQNVNLKTDKGEYEFIATTHPDNELKGYMGVNVEPIRQETKGLFSVFYNIMFWLQGLFFWTVLISINVGLFNLFPIFITDGARMAKITTDKYVKNKKKSKTIWLAINKICLMFLLSMLALQLYNVFI